MRANATVGFGVGGVGEAIMHVRSRGGGRGRVEGEGGGRLQHVVSSDMSRGVHVQPMGRECHRCGAEAGRAGTRPHTPFTRPAARLHD